MPFDLQPIDVLLLVLLALAALSGWRRGFAMVLLGYLAWPCTGWLVGVGFVRFGAWGGIAFIPVAAMPAVASELAYLRPSVLVAAGLVAVLASGAWGTWWLARGVEVRQVAT